MDAQKPPHFHPESEPGQSSDSRPKVEGFSLGPFETNCYIVTASGADSAETGAGSCWVIDPGFEPDEILAALRERRLRPEAIILTHAHLDHIGGVADVLRA